jgi:hypothetical protein
MPAIKRDTSANLAGPATRFFALNVRRLFLSSLVRRPGSKSEIACESAPTVLAEWY